MQVRVAGAAKLVFLKNHRDLKNLYFLNICRNLPCSSKNSSKKENSKLKFFYIFFYFPKMGKTVLDLNNSKHFFGFFSFLAFKKSKNIKPPYCRFQKHYFFMFADFRVTVHIFRGPACYKLISNIKSLNFWNW